MDSPATSKRAAFAVQSQDRSTEQGRAARYFATHGMGKIGRLLGEQLSSSESAKAMEEDAASRRQLEKLGAATAQPVKASSASFGHDSGSSIDLDAIDREQEQE